MEPIHIRQIIPSLWGCFLRASAETVAGRRRSRFPLGEMDAAGFLAREEITLDAAGIRGYLTHKTVLVTGGGGSIGSELCRQAMKFSPASLCIFDFNENNAYKLLHALRQAYGQDARVQALIGSVQDRKRLDDVLEKVRPDVIFHAAAHKHVSLMEDCPGEAIKNNVSGTRNVLESASLRGVSRFVLLSTDKAVNPANVMGATKRVCELLVRLYASQTKMKCMAVRFGNVLGSSGSVIPLFDQQIRSGGPVTITHPEITRYFMTIPEAAQLVLQAGALADSGAVYVLDMGAPVKIVDLAKKMIRFYNYTPDKEIKIVFTGLRPGEKMHEELLMDSEKRLVRRTSHERIAIAPPTPLDAAALRRLIWQLESSTTQNAKDMRALLRQIVETYRPLEDMLEVVGV